MTVAGRPSKFKASSTHKKMKACALRILMPRAIFTCKQCNRLIKLMKLRASEAVWWTLPSCCCEPMSYGLTIQEYYSITKRVFVTFWSMSFRIPMQSSMPGSEYWPGIASPSWQWVTMTSRSMVGAARESKIFSGLAKILRTHKRFV